MCSKIYVLFNNSASEVLDMEHVNLLGTFVFESNYFIIKNQILKKRLNAHVEKPSFFLINKRSSCF